MPRLTNSAFRDLAIWMVGLGLATGIIFPPFALVLGLPASGVLTPAFIGASIGAGLMVGALNFGLARITVGRRLGALVARMGTVRSGIETATWTGDWSACTPEQCALPVDSEDAFGEAARAFNGLIGSLSVSHGVESAIREFSSTLAAHSELDQVCRNALDQLRHLGGAEGGALLVDMDGELAIGAAAGLVQPETLLGNAVVADALRDGVSRRLDAPHGVAIDAVVTAFPVRSIVVLPLVFKNIPVGVGLVASSTLITDETVRLLELLRPLLAVAVNNALTHERVQRLATIDPLTGVYNRRFGLARLHEEWKRTIRTELPLAVAMLDIDHFKAINDTYGHAVGDRVLVATAKAVRRALREGDVLVRYGGEEFLILLLGGSLEDGAVVGERIRRAIGETVVQDGDQAIRVTASLGIASTTHAEATAEEDLVRLADAALYEAKAAGRDRIVVA